MCRSGRRTASRCAGTGVLRTIWYRSVTQAARGEAVVQICRRASAAGVAPHEIDYFVDHSNQSNSIIEVSAS